MPTLHDKTSTDTTDTPPKLGADKNVRAPITPFAFSATRGKHQADNHIHARGVLEKLKTVF